MITISFINASTGVPDVLAEQTMKDLQTQVTRDFYPIWGVNAQLQFVGKGQKPKTSNWWLSLLDNSDQAGALGYHDLTSLGQPIGKAFVKTCQQYGVSWTVDASHELLEMLADPDINLICMDDSGSRLYAYEVGDPVQDDTCGYEINSTVVSDFVYPAFFQPSSKNAQFSHGKHVSAPLTMAKGGYMSYMDINSTQGWQQMTADSVPSSLHTHTGGRKRMFRARAAVGSRRERRRTPKSQWMFSTVEAE